MKRRSCACLPDRLSHKDGMRGPSCWASHTFALWRAPRRRRNVATWTSFGANHMTWVLQMSKILHSKIAVVSVSVAANRDQLDAEAWPRLMDARTAARFCGEPSVRAYRRRCRVPGDGNQPGKIYPTPIAVSGMRAKWDRVQLDQAIDKLTKARTGSAEILDAASVL